MVPANDPFLPPPGRQRPRVAVAPELATFAVDAVLSGGGELVPLEAAPEALVWLDPRDMAGLADALARSPGIGWVQLPFAGVEHAVESGLVGPERVWTCAKGAYAEPVAEHALALSLAGLRRLPERVHARRWGEQAGQSLFDETVVLVGGGGIARALLRLLEPFRARVCVVRRRVEPLPGADAVVGPGDLRAVVADALLVVLCLALTPQTTRIVDAAVLEAMRADAWLVNVARGAHVDTDALVAALEARRIGGAALDVTDPEPLPEGHPLWRLPNCIVTPHTADTPEMVRPLLARRIRDNVARFAAGEPLVGVVDPEHGY